jgi:type VI protein secretion system component VasK
MVGTDNAEKSRLLCRFLSELRLAEGKIAAFITDFSSRPGRAVPQLGGFFLTPAHSGRILGDVIPGAKPKVRENGAGTPGYWAKKVCFYLLTAMICAAATFGIAGSGLRDALHMRTLKAELSSLLADEPTMENQYMALSKLRRSYHYLQGTVKSPGRLIFGADKARKKVRDAYIAASEQVMIVPAAKYLESSVARQSQGRAGELTAETHQSLYNDFKTYLLLTGGDKVNMDDAAPIAEIFERALKSSSSQRYRPPDDKIVKDNVGTVIKFAADGHYQDRADKSVVQAARLMLAAAPRADVLYASVMDQLHARHRNVPIDQIAGKNELLRYSRDISALYTRDVWEQTVYAELINVSKDPFKADWVMGPVRAHTDETTLLSELVSLYSDDLCRRWLDFIRNIHVGLPSDIPSLARDLERLSSRNSETRRMLTVVCSLATQQAADLTRSPPSSASISAIKGQITNVSNRLRGNGRGLTHDAHDPFADARKVFGALDTFLTGGGFDDYIGTISALSESLKECDDRGVFASTFVSRGDDPIKISRRGLARACASMPPALSAALKRVLESPLDITAGLLARKISTEIEESWQAEIVTHFNARLAPRNPFNKNGADLSWNDFEEFFHPKNGILWKYQEKNLRGLMERTPKGWERVPARSMSIRISVDDEVIRACNRAEKIAGNFFRNDGVPKRQHSTFYPFISPRNTALSPAQSGSEAMSGEMAMRGFAVPKKVLRD